MQALVFALVSLALSIAAESSCGTREDITQQCFNAVCQPNPTFEGIITDMASQLEQHSYTLPASLPQRLSKVLESRRATLVSQRAFVDRVGLPKLIDQMIENFEVSTILLNQFFEREYSIIYAEGGGRTLIVSSTGRNPELFSRVGRFMLEEEQLSDSYGSKESALLLLDEMARYYQGSDSRLAKRIVAQRDLLATQAPEESIPDFESLFTTEQVLAMRRARFNAYRMELMQAVQEMLPAGPIPSVTDEMSRLLPRIHQSCRAVDFIEQRLAKAPENLDSCKAEVIRGMNEKFLPLIPQASSRCLQSRMLEVKITMFPYEPADNAVFRLAMYREEVGVFADYESLLDVLNGTPEIDPDIVACNFKKIAYSDKFNFGTGEIYPSPLAMGLGQCEVLAHEFGHWVHSTLVNSCGGNQQLSEIQSCIQGFYPPAMGVNNFTEDFGDWFSSTISSNRRGYFCDQSTIPLTLQVLSDVRPTNDSYRPQPDYMHSGDLFRQLHFLMVTGQQVPLICRQLMDSSTVGRPQRCSLDR